MDFVTTRWTTRFTGLSRKALEIRVDAARGRQPIDPPRCPREELGLVLIAEALPRTDALEEVPDRAIARALAVGREIRLEHAAARAKRVDGVRIPAEEVVAQLG